MIPYIFVSTLPRSGSTLLMNLLGQNPKFHVTPTNDLIELVVNIRNIWTNQISFKAQGLNIVKPRVIKCMRKMFDGFFEEEINQNKIIFDKSRGWFAYIELLEEIFEEKIKLICTVRSIKDIVASFEILDRKNKMTKPTITGDEFFRCQSIEGRAQSLLDKTAVLGLAITRLRDALDRGMGDRITIIPYGQLVTNPIETMTNLHNILGLETFEYDPNNVKQITHEDDTVHGMELHKIRENNIDTTAIGKWKGILSEKTVNWLDREYSDIEKMCKH